MKNILLFSALLGLFAIDIIKVKLYPDPVPEPIVADPSIENTKNKHDDNDLSNIKDEDLKLDDDQTDKTSGANENNDNVLLNDGDLGNKLLIHIKHCTSYASRVDKFKKDLQGSIANLEITTANYPAASEKEILSKVVTFVQYALIGIIIGGASIRNYLPFIPGAVFDFIESKKMMIGIFTYFGVNQIQSMLTQTGAFEVYANNELIWSTLTEKLMPTIEKITEILTEGNYLSIDSS